MSVCSAGTESEKEIGVDLAIAGNQDVTIGQDFMVTATIVNKSSEARYVCMYVRHTVEVWLVGISISSWVMWLVGISISSWVMWLVGISISSWVSSRRGMKSVIFHVTLGSLATFDPVFATSF